MNDDLEAAEKWSGQRKSEVSHLTPEKPLRLARTTHVDETVSQSASPSERIRHSLEDGLAAGLFARLAEVLDLKAADGEFAIGLVQPASLARSGGKREEGDATDRGGKDSLCAA